jgi:hypothetical protein
MELLPHPSYPDVFFRTTDGTTNKDVPNLAPAYTSSVAPGILYKAGEKFDPGTFSSELVVGQTDVDNLRTKILDAGKFAQSVVGVFHPNTSLVLGDEVVTDMLVDFSKAKLTATGVGAKPSASKRRPRTAPCPRRARAFSPSASRATASRSKAPSTPAASKRPGLPAS